MTDFKKKLEAYRDSLGKYPRWTKGADAFIPIILELAEALGKADKLIPLRNMLMVQGNTEQGILTTYIKSAPKNSTLKDGEIVYDFLEQARAALDSLRDKLKK